MDTILIEGVVVEGRKMGRTLGFPTANINLDNQYASISNGVYRSRVSIGGECYDAVTNIGVNPTVGEVRRRAESHIFDFVGDIYGITIQIELCDKLRDESRFSSLDQLKAQIEQDVAQCHALRAASAR